MASEATLHFKGPLERLDNAYTAAKSLEEIKRLYRLNDIIRLGANENNWGYSSRVKKAIRDSQRLLSLYPDNDCSKLRRALAQRLHIDGEELVFGHGSFELLSLTAQVTLSPGDEAIIPEPTFNWYRIITQSAGANPVSVPLRAHTVGLSDVAAAVTPKTRVVWLCNPNNPTGTIFTHGALVRFLDGLRGDIFVVLDEAYCDFADCADYPDTQILFRRYPNLIILRTFSKSYGLAGMRVGYAIANRKTAGVLNKFRPPMNVSCVAQAAALAALSDTAYQYKVLSKNARGRDYYYKKFEELGLTYIPTQTNFLMVDLGTDAAPVTEELLKRGILIRCGAEYGMPTFVRITIGRPRENAALLRNLTGLLAL